MSGKLPPMAPELVERARRADVLETAERFGVKLKYKLTATERASACPRCGGDDRFRVNIRKQTWLCRGCGKGGAGALSLVEYVEGLDFHSADDDRRADDFRRAVAWLTGGDTRAPIPATPKAPDLDVEKRAAAIARSVACIIGELVPLRGSPGERYLAEVRNIDVDAIADVLARLDAIGWHPAVYFNEPEHQLHQRKLGAIIGVMTDPVTAKPTGAISRTYLAPDLTKIGKAKTLGAPAGIIRLSLDEDVLGGLHIAEGLETSLDLLSQDFVPMWATGSTSIMAKFPVLGGIEYLTIFADRDQNRAGENAAMEAALRWREAGREARVRRIKNGLGDFNDATRAAR
jgi:putative DNA primase/helicase